MNRVQKSFEIWFKSENGYAPEKRDDGRYKQLAVTRQYEAWIGALEWVAKLIKVPE